MEDMERYGDYDDYEFDAPKSKNPVLILMKVLIALVCLSVVGVLVFRMIFFNYYPDSMKNIYFTDGLISYYEETAGDIGAETQELRAPYDDPDRASFFCDNLIVIRGAGELQLSVRFNSSAMEDFLAASDYKKLLPSDPELLTFRLQDNYGNIYENLVYSEYDSKLMYHYYKLAFDGIEFFDLGDGTYPEWIRLEVFIKGQKDMSKPFSMVAVYENNENYARFEPYRLSEEELPK